ncbi:MAG: hypothetical protein L3J70_03485 [Gammaproteobacteria bacterium]|nr:hypothetical protein [Gammaproteobacteria bacterium]
MKNKKLLKPYGQLLFLATVFMFFLSACASDSASHLPSPLELPGAIIGSAFENTIYKAKRKKVASYVAKNYLAIRQDVMQGGGKALEGALDVTGIKGGKRDETKNDLITNKADYFQNSDIVTDALINRFISLYSVKQKDKKINGFSYTEARLVIKNYTDKNFEALRISIQQGEGSALKELASQLNINDMKKQAQFKQQSRQLYETLYLEPVIVVLMVNK